LPFVAGVGSDSVRGVDNGTYQYSYDAMPNAKTAVLASAGMDGGDGGWPVLMGDDALPASSGTINLSFDEDQLKDSERKHTTEQVAYFVIDPPVQEDATAAAMPAPDGPAGRWQPEDRAARNFDRSTLLEQTMEDRREWAGAMATASAGAVRSADDWFGTASAGEEEADGEADSWQARVDELFGFAGPHLFQR